MSQSKPCDHPAKDSDISDHHCRACGAGRGSVMRDLRAQLATAARALLVLEWGKDSWCQSCRTNGPEHGFTTHREGCALDAALVALGYPTQVERDAARSK